MKKSQRIEDELKKNLRVWRKYNSAGIYSISIGEKIVYIGKSKKMISRLANHIFFIQHLQQTKSHKYEVLALAELMGYKVKFDVLYYSITTGKKMEEDIGRKEAEFINRYHPPLNYQIPDINDYHHYTINRTAKTISLLDILGEDK